MNSLVSFLLLIYADSHMLSCHNHITLSLPLSESTLNKIFQTFTIALTMILVHNIIIEALGQNPTEIISKPFKIPLQRDLNSYEGKAQLRIRFAIMSIVLL